MSWIQTFTGQVFDPFKTEPETIKILDIGHALANTCRFGGHIKTFYSVAQHSVVVSNLVPKPLALWGLLHDAAEAYLGDIPRPIKANVWFGEDHVESRGNGYHPYTNYARFKTLENALLKQIHSSLSLAWPLNEPETASIKKADNIALVTEAKNLLEGGPIRGWGKEIGAEPLEDFDAPLMPEEAKDLFIARFEELS